ncbi:radical SAM protein, partial [Limnoraphis robusta CCNP1324]|uniref:radical SAM protein n=1 Tax=Limnoraphis robusta TaxID=1118279 RepID=UPI002B210C54
MRSFLSKLRLKWFLATRTLDFSVDFTNILYRTYLNHDKIIHYRDGHPVYSLMTPAIFSRPSANFVARALFRSIQNKNMPNLMSFAVNDVCNAACEHCSFFSAVEEPGRPVLSLEQAAKLIADAQDLGVSVINFVGGEPLMRDDLDQLIASVDKDRSTTLLYTNGWELEKRAK